jgi:uncharacterized protein (TIGR00369 family)
VTATPPPELGPFSSSLGFRLVEVGEERVVMEAMPGPEHANGGGILHGGYLTSLLDSTTGWAVHASLPADQAAPHTSLTVQYLRAALPGTTLVCTGRCLRAGRRVAAAEAEIVQDGKVLARAMTGHTVLSPLA